MRGTLKIQDVLKQFKGVLTIDWLTSAMAMWSATVIPPETIPAFAEMTVEREGEEIFAGIIMEPTIEYGLGGTTRPLKGYDHTIKLLDYLCPYQSLVDVSTEAAVTAILTNWPYLISVEGTFGYLGDPTIIDTTCEMLELDFTNTCIEYDQVEERESEPDTDVNVCPDPEFRSAFFYDGTTKRQYMFYGTLGTLRYRWTDDCGATWSGEIDTALAIVANHFSVGWYNSKIYVFLEDGAGNTDFYRGTINDGTGAVTLVLIVGNMFLGAWMKAGPFFTPNGNIWCIEDLGGGGNRAWESVNDGNNWFGRFVGTETLWYMLPKADGEDMWLIQWDAVNNHLELWDWVKATTTEGYVSQIRNFGADLLQHVAGCQTADYSIRLAYSDDDNDLWYRGANIAAWGAERAVTASLINVESFHITGDRYNYAYIGYFDAGGFRVAKGSDTTYSAGVVMVAQQGTNISAPACGLWDGQVGCFFEFIGFNDDLWFWLPAPLGIRIDEGQTTGYFQTQTITASGSFVWWGWVTADGIQLVDTLWSILRAGDDSVLVDNQGVPFDMKLAGVPETELTIKVKCDMTDTGTDPLVSEFDYSEYVDEVTMDTDLTEDTYVGIDKLRALSGAEFWVTKDNGTFTLHFSDRRGSDKSNVVVLKNAHSSKRPDVRPNIKLISVTPDWERFANSVMIVGAGTAGVDRIEESIQDWDSVGIYGEKWYSEPNLDIVTTAMGRTRAAIVLQSVNVVIERIKAAILDKYETGNIEIGDTAWFCIDFADLEDQEIDEALRMIGLTRMYSPTGGEKVEITVVNVIKATEYWNYLGTVSDLSRWAVL